MNLDETWKRRVNYIAPWELEWLIKSFVTEALVPRLVLYNKAVILLFYWAREELDASYWTWKLSEKGTSWLLFESCSEHNDRPFLSICPPNKTKRRKKVNSQLLHLSHSLFLSKIYYNYNFSQLWTMTDHQGHFHIHYFWRRSWWNNSSRVNFSEIFFRFYLNCWCN